MVKTTRTCDFCRTSDDGADMDWEKLSVEVVFSGMDYSILTVWYDCCPRCTAFAYRHKERIQENLKAAMVRELT